MLTCEPYKSELHPLWKFKTPHKERNFRTEIINKFFKYLEDGDFVGVIWQKYLHMGFTRSRRYYNHSSETKWTQENGEWKVLPFDRNEKGFRIK